jgi:hypothetical protein
MKKRSPCCENSSFEKEARAACRATGASIEDVCCVVGGAAATHTYLSCQTWRKRAQGLVDPSDGFAVSSRQTEDDFDRLQATNSGKNQAIAPQYVR